MRVVKIILVLLLVIVAAGFVAMMVIPTKKHTERSITINAPISDVYAYLARLENFSQWSGWNSRDASIKNTLAGTDATMDASTHWVGDSSEGHIRIIGLNGNKLIKHEISYLKPEEKTARSNFRLISSNGQTNVTWEFEVLTPRPQNLLSVFKKDTHKSAEELEAGLRNLKQAIETGKTASASSAKQYSVEQMNFPATRYITMRKVVSWSNMSAFFASSAPKLYAAVSANKIEPGIFTGIYYTWDELNKQTDMAAAVSIPADANISNDSLQVVDLPASKAVYLDYYGAYDNLMKAYSIVDGYLTENKLKQKAPVIEQYLKGPSQETDTSKWLTRIIYLVE